ncbi:Serine-threonine protein kinase [Entamoeba marina]
MFLFLLVVFTNALTECSTTQYWDQTSTSCVSCVSPCNTCYNSTQCTSCVDNYYLSAGYLCIERDLDTNCKEYDADHCILCNEGYYISNAHCYSCAVENCAYCSISKCFQCENDLVLYESDDTQSCIDCTLSENDAICGRCPSGTYFNESSYSCSSCRSGCLNCTSGTNCYRCDTDTVLSDPSNTESECVKLEGCIDGYYYGDHCELCESSYYLENGYCSNCSDNCIKCVNSTTCLECSEGMMLTAGSCQEDVNCLRPSSYSGCLECVSGWYIDEDVKCSQCPSQCEKCLNSTYYKGTCEAMNSRTCEVVDQYGCLRCAYDVSYDEEIDGTTASELNDMVGGGVNYTSFLFGYYLPILTYTDTDVTYSPECSMCDVRCRICEYEFNWCTGCNDGYALEENETASAEYLKIFGCKETDMGYCVECDDSHFLFNVRCVQCDESCDTCIDPDYCQTCNTTVGSDGDALWWRKPSFNSLEGEEKGLCNFVDNSTEDFDIDCDGYITTSGCSSCKTNHYLSDGECLQCPTNCYNCVEQTDEDDVTSVICTECLEDTEYLDSSSACVNCSTIENCVKCNTNGCYECASGYSVSSTRLECTHVNLALIIPLVSVSLIIIIIVVIIVAVLFWLRRRKVMKDRETEIKPFKVGNSVEMALLSADNENFPLKTDKWNLDFGFAGSKAVIDKEYEEVINFNNTTKKSYFFEIMLGATHKYALVANPMRFTLKPDTGVPVHFSLTMLCTTSVKDEIGVVAMSMDEDLKETAKISLVIESDLSTKLDHTEIQLDLPAIGEGAFGMVFKGTYRGQKVAVKKMKARNLTEEQEKEFKHEVNMLTQYRHQTIVNLIGAVYTEGEISIVTEFADFGSLSKIWGHQTVPYELKIKIMEDLAVSLAYLHENNIIHRDVKGENMLVYSLNPHSSVCSKLTDFGTCRNISERALNAKELTFGIGTPTYMSPECLANTNYTYSADVFSYAMVLYETYTETQAYIDDERFNQPWMIPQFVIEGKRLEKPNGIPENYWDLIEKCWVQDPNQRPNFNEVLNILVSWNLDICHTEAISGEGNFDSVPQVAPSNVPEAPQSESSESSSSSSSSDDDN